MIFFIIVVLVLLPLLHLYLWRRLIHDTMRPGRGRVIATCVMVGLVVLMLAALMVGTRVHPDVARWFAWPGYLWLAMFFYLLLGLLVLEVPRYLVLRRGSEGVGESSGEVGGGSGAEDAGSTGGAVGVRASERTVAASPALSRRLVISRGSALLAGAAATGLVGYGMTVALGSPSVNTVPIALRRLDPRASGFRIALISDLHLGPILGRAFSERVVELVNAQRVDAVAIAGDLVDGSVANLGDATEPIADLRSTHGTFFVTGNHEYYSDYAEWVDYLPRLGVRVLRNERETITHNGGSFELAGINDATGYQWQDAGDVGKAVRGRDPERAVVLMAHQPVDLKDAVEHAVDLMLAGHTHGGQLSPFEYLVTLQQGAVAGLYRERNTQMYVTRGAGFWGPPVRVGAPPEVVVVELRAG